ncbi:lysophospholipase L1-like esterase [Kitasatospora sp. MAP12-15]|uniref:SGNH/GDSL hydrolase family protein n=1 Tax=unclassified Kitasatospora TaxID=2633591 RepID=UPI0024753D0A|nr:SGNH/GDSL hydrolase family protein [Kitasatospora sp. MAP12-44]MDH6109418.1 lysophospholipase L1-like esterase [Kitasatospora sp. MAP12-44]
MPIALTPGEAADPYCLREGEAATLLAGHPWRRFVVVGDSIAEGLGEPSPGYPDDPWVFRVAAELAAVKGGFSFHNLGRRSTRAEQVRTEQLTAALELRPDLALVACGGFNLLSRSYDPEAIEADLRAIVEALQAGGAQVITVSMFDGSYSPAVPEELRAGLRTRLYDLTDRTERIAAQLGTVQVSLTDHPASRDADLYSADGRHGTRRSHAIAAAETVRALGARVRAAGGSTAEAGR